MEDIQTQQIIQSENPQAQQAPQEQINDTQPTNAAPSIIVMLIILLVLITGVVIFYISYKRKSTIALQKPTNTAQLQQAKIPSDSANITPNPTNTTDASLNQDTQAIDNSLSNLSGDESSLNQSLNDQQTNLQ